MYGSIAGALVSILALGGMIASSEYRPATVSEVVEIAGLVNKNAADILIVQLEANQRQIYENLSRQDAVKASGGDLSNLKQQHLLLIQRRNRLERELLKLEDN